MRNQKEKKRLHRIAAAGLVVMLGLGMTMRASATEAEAKSTGQETSGSLAEAQKEKEANDYQVAECWGLGKDGYLYLLDMIRGKYQAYELQYRIPAFWAKMKSQYGAKLRYMMVEDKASGTQLIQTIQRELKPKIPVRPIERSRSKLERVMDVQPCIQSGYLKLPRNAPFVTDFIDECEHFTPNDTHPHDDQIDCMCDAVSTMLIAKQPEYRDVV